MVDGVEYVIRMNLYNPIFWMVAPIIPYQFINVPTYLGLKGISILFRLKFFLLLDDTLIGIHMIRAILSCIAKNEGMYELVSYDTYKFVPKCYAKIIHNSISFL
jgi:hypothetical protein